MTQRPAGGIAGWEGLLHGLVNHLINLFVSLFVVGQHG